MSDQPDYKFTKDGQTGAVPTSDANTYQVGGQHYQSNMQHWDYVLANQIPYLEAMIIKYLTRWRRKNGFQDLEKAKHFLKKLYESQGFGWENLAEKTRQVEGSLKTINPEWATAEELKHYSDKLRQQDPGSQGLVRGGVSACEAGEPPHPYNWR